MSDHIKVVNPFRNDKNAKKMDSLQDYRGPCKESHPPAAYLMANTLHSPMEDQGPLCSIVSSFLSKPMVLPHSQLLRTQ